MLRILPAVLVLLLCALPARAQTKFQYLGPNECLNCHDHDAERDWYEKKEIPEVRRLFPDRDAKAGHINSLNQLEAPKSDEFAKAIGQADKYDVNGKCVGCHATVFRGDANAGVSCEMCHGPGSGYLKPHQTKDTYDLSVSTYGMTRLIGNIQGWTQQCTNCHVMDDDRLIKAGHPSGDDWDLSKKFVPVSLHFKKKYTEQDVAAIAKPQMAAILEFRRTGKVSTSAAPAAPAAPTPPPPPPAPANTATTVAPAAPAAPEKSATPPVASEIAKPAASRTAPAVTAAKDAIAPPPGSPTSIEPKFPIPQQATAPAPAAQAPAAAQQAPAVPMQEPIQTSTLIGAGLILLGVAAGAFWFFSRK